MENKGYILLHRKILNNELWNDGEKYCKKAAWIWMLLAVNHKDKDKFFDGKMITIHRGQKLTSMLKLAKEWGVDRKTVKKWLLHWKNAEMIYVEFHKHWTMITVRNYAEYQDFWRNNRKGMDNELDNEKDNGMDNPMDNPMDNDVDTNNKCINKNKIMINKNNKKERPPQKGDWQ